MLLHYRVILNELVINALPHHTSISNAAVDNTYLLIPWSRVLLEKLTGFAVSQEIPRIYGTRKFITVPTSAYHLFLS
jgi:hypothetical protein